MEQDYTWEYNPPEAKTDGRWEQEVFRTLYTTCIKASNDLWRQNKDGNITRLRKLTADPATVCALESIPNFKIEKNIDYEEISPIHKVGELSGFEIFRDMTQTENKISIEWCDRTAIIHVKGLNNSSVGETP